MQFIVSKFHVYKVCTTRKEAAKYARENRMNKITILLDGVIIGTIIV